MLPQRQTYTEGLQQGITRFFTTLLCVLLSPRSTGLYLLLRKHRCAVLSRLEQGLPSQAQQVLHLNVFVVFLFKDGEDVESRQNLRRFQKKLGERDAGVKRRQRFVVPLCTNNSVEVS